MREYIIPSTIAGMLTGYPTGAVLRDSESYEPDTALKQYLDDVVGVYIEQLHVFVSVAGEDIGTRTKLETLFAEICKIKRMLAGSVESI